MAVEVTENRDRKHTRGLSGMRTFVVTGVTSEVQAAFAADYRTGLAIPPIYSFWPDDRTIMSRVPAVDRTAFGIYTVSVSYAPPSHTVNDASQVQEDGFIFKIGWQYGFKTVDVNLDAEGMLIKNSAGDPYEPLPNEKVTRFFTIWRTETRYRDDLDVFVDCVNSDDITLPGPRRLRLTTGQCRCDNIDPGEYAVNQEAVNVAYRFEIDFEGFDWKILDQGRRGWRTLSGTVVGPLPFYDKDGKQLATPVHLDGTGKPLAPDIGVGSPSPSAPTTPNAPASPPGFFRARYEAVRAADESIYFKIPKKKRRAFKDLGLFI